MIAFDSVDDALDLLPSFSVVQRFILKVVELIFQLPDSSVLRLGSGPSQSKDGAENEAPIKDEEDDKPTLKVPIVEVGEVRHPHQYQDDEGKIEQVTDDHCPLSD